jgi:hypothetical protein
MSFPSYPYQTAQYPGTGQPLYSAGQISPQTVQQYPQQSVVYSTQAQKSEPVSAQRPAPDNAAPPRATQANRPETSTPQAESRDSSTPQSSDKNVKADVQSAKIQSKRSSLASFSKLVLSLTYVDSITVQDQRQTKFMRNE